MNNLKEWKNTWIVFKDVENISHVRLLRHEFNDIKINDEIFITKGLNGQRSIITRQPHYAFVKDFLLPKSFFVTDVIKNSKSNEIIIEYATKEYFRNQKLNTLLNEQ